MQFKVEQALLAENIKNRIANEILQLPSVQRWLKFLQSPQFMLDFGVGKGIAANIYSRFLGEIQNIYVERKPGFISIFAINQTNLRTFTRNNWEGKLVNAWDIYEGGTIGAIKGYSVIKKAGYGRSNLGIMIQTDQNFEFTNGIAPTPMSIANDIFLKYRI